MGGGEGETRGRISRSDPGKLSFRRSIANRSDAGNAPIRSRFASPVIADATMPSGWNGFTYPAVTERDVEREIYLTSVGRIAHAPGDPYPAPGHPRRYRFKRGGVRRLNDFAVVWIERGRGHVESAATGRQPFPANTALILPPGAAHHTNPTPRRAGSSGGSAPTDRISIACGTRATFRHVRRCGF